MDPYHPDYPSTCPWNTSTPTVGSSAYESDTSTFPTNSSLSYPVAQSLVDPNVLGNQNFNRIPTTSVYENNLPYPVAQPPVDPNILGNQDSYRIHKTSGVMDLDNAKDSSTCPWNTYSSPVGPSVYDSSRASFSPFCDSSFQSTQSPANPRVLETQNSNKYQTTSGVQCLWETDGKICHHRYQSPEELTTHISSTHVPKRMKVCHWKNCGRQGKPVQDRFKLVNHLRSHTGETPFECDLCGKRFVTAANQRIHRRIHTGEKPFLCPVDGCSERFTTPTQLMIHKKMHLDPKPYHCEECDKKYTSLSSLQKHTNKCDRKYAWSSTLRKHVKKHHEKKSDGSSNSGGSSIDALSVSELVAPAYQNQASIPNDAQVEEHSGVYDDNYQVDYYSYNNYGYPPM